MAFFDWFYCQDCKDKNKLIHQQSEALANYDKQYFALMNELLDSQAKTNFIFKIIKEHSLTTLFNEKIKEWEKEHELD